jgi:alkylation response protein AidB-like acyl-CoA dehydrogenase
VLVMAFPEGARSPSAGIILMLPQGAEGRSVDPNWDVLGMRATRSDSLILDECWLPETAAVFRSDDVRPFRHAYLNWFWGSYTPVYLGVAQAAFDELRKVIHTRRPEGYAQPLAYHPDVRRHVAQMSADLEAARLITYRSAWLSDTRTFGGNNCRSLPGQIHGRRGGESHYPHGPDTRRRARHIQDLAAGAAIPRRRTRPATSAAFGFLPLQHGPLRAGHRPRRPTAAAEAGVVAHRTAATARVLAQSSAVHWRVSLAAGGSKSHSSAPSRGAAILRPRCAPVFIRRKDRTACVLLFD